MAAVQKDTCQCYWRVVPRRRRIVATHVQERGDFQQPQAQSSLGTAFDAAGTNLQVLLGCCLRTKQRKQHVSCDTLSMINKRLSTAKHETSKAGTDDSRGRLELGSDTVLDGGIN